MRDLPVSIQKIINDDPSEIKNIGSFTSVHNNPAVIKNIPHYLNKNLVDKKGYKSLSIFEKAIDRFFKKRFDNDEGTTIVTSGSTESVLLAFFYMREKARDERGITKPNIIIPEHAHYSLGRCARMLNIEIKEVKVNYRGAIDTKEVREIVDKNTILIVGMLVSTELGIIDNLVELDRIAAENNTYLHVDAAIGGFIIPYLDTDVKYRFTELTHMASMNVSGHKFGLSLCGAGVLMMRDKHIIEKYAQTIEYLSSGTKRMDNFMVTSSALGLFSLYANISTYGLSGYRKFARKYMKTKHTLLKKLTDLGFNCYTGSEYAPHVMIYGDDIYDLSRFLEKRGWVQHPYKAKGFPYETIRIVVKKDQEHRLLTTFIDDVKEYKRYVYQKIDHQEITPIEFKSAEIPSGHASSAPSAPAVTVEASVSKESL